jgi:uncharacterized RDD family membrane protein YckC
MKNKRFIAGAIDFFIVAIIQSILMSFFIMKPLIEQQIEVNQVMILNLQITLISMSYLIFRDIFGKRSIGKRFLKLKIVDIKTNDTANFMSRLLRNITWLLGPVEIIVLLASGKRIGDKIAKTKIEVDDQS